MMHGVVFVAFPSSLTALFGSFNKLVERVSELLMGYDRSGKDMTWGDLLIFDERRRWNKSGEGGPENKTILQPQQQPTATMTTTTTTTHSSPVRVISVRRVRRTQDGQDKGSSLTVQCCHHRPTCEIERELQNLFYVEAVLVHDLVGLLVADQMPRLPNQSNSKLCKAGGNWGCADRESERTAGHVSPLDLSHVSTLAARTLAGRDQGAITTPRFTRDYLCCHDGRRWRNTRISRCPKEHNERALDLKEKLSSTSTTTITLTTTTTA